ncbi:hypothetical protein AQUCO_03600139v1 [Aquilegia coerulea]|uniref:Uncharacterized protein n=1 Tax=Aquilegia coerulea TaxID=218851 RepID=A0A2G5CVG5_AQUCA|nr:hypothetical protein AQUCO_03600139v1 [Aquilegia coerulea]
MAGVMGRIPVGSRIFIDSCHGVEFSGETSNSDDFVFEFFEVGEGSLDSVSVSSGNTDEFDDGEENEISIDHINKRKAFWESQHQLLHTTLSRTSSMESKIRQATKEALRESQLEGVVCVCRRPVIGGCRNCLLKEIADRLRNAGFNSAICKSKWRSSPDIPSGEYTYLDVGHKSSTTQVEVRVVIELNFRAQFEMARANEEYNRLIDRLPEVFVGKAERLRSLIKILSSAAKKCMKENKMHMGPWRKHKYMQAKWFGTCERTQSQPLPQQLPARSKKPKASMLTFDLLDMLPSLQHFTAVEVV